MRLGSIFTFRSHYQSNEIKGLCLYIPHHDVLCEHWNLGGTEKEGDTMNEEQEKLNWKIEIWNYLYFFFFRFLSAVGEEGGKNNWR